MKSWLKGKNNYIQYILFVVMAILFMFIVLNIVDRDAWKITNPNVIAQSITAIVLICGVWLILWVTKKENWILLLLSIILLLTRELVALAGILVFAWANFAVGSWILSKFFSYENNLKHQIIAFFMGMSINAYFVWMFMHFQMNYWWIYLLFLGAEILIFRKIWWQWCKEFNLNKIKFTWSDRIVLLFIIFFIPYVITKTYNWDDVVKHLTIAKHVAMFGIFDFDPRFVVSLDSSIIPQSSYVTGYIIGNEVMVRMINFLMFALAWLLLNEKLKKYSTKIASIGMLFLILTPFTLWQISIVFIDSFNLFSAVVLFVIFWDLLKKLDGKNIILFFVIAAFAFLCKQQAVYLIIPMILLLFVEIIWKRRDLIKNYLVGGILSLILISVFLGYTYVKTGNPLFPWYNGIFQSEYLSPDNVGTMWKIDSFGLDTIYQLSFEGDKFIENHPYSFGLLYIFLIWFIVVLFFDWKKNQIKIKLLLLFILSSSMWIFLTGPYQRYFISIAPIGAVLLAFTFQELLKIFDNKILKIGSWVFLGTILIFNYVFMLGIYYVPNVYPWQSFVDRNFESNMYKNTEKIMDQAHDKYGKNSKGLLIDSPALYFADTNIESLYWYHQKNYDETIGMELKGKELVDQIFEKMGFDYIVMPKSTTYKAFWEDEFVNHTKIIGEEGGIVLVEAK